MEVVWMFSPVLIWGWGPRWATVDTRRYHETCAWCKFKCSSLMNASDLIIVSSSCSAALEVAECFRPQKHLTEVIKFKTKPTPLKSDINNEGIVALQCNKGCLIDTCGVLIPLTKCVLQRWLGLTYCVSWVTTNEHCRKIIWWGRRSFSTKPPVVPHATNV